MDIDYIFKYHPPKDEQILIYQNIREMGKNFARHLQGHLPDCTETRFAIAKIREAVMWANASIACYRDPSILEAPEDE